MSSICDICGAHFYKWTHETEEDCEGSPPPVRRGRRRPPPAARVHWYYSYSAPLAREYRSRGQNAVWRIHAVPGKDGETYQSLADCLKV